MKSSNRKSKIKVMACAVLLACHTLFANAAEQKTKVVKYDGSLLPSLSGQPFEEYYGAKGTQASSGGLLTMSVEEQAGSITNIRLDPFNSSDSASFDFRVKIDSTFPITSGAMQGAVVQLRWGESSGSLVLFVSPTGIAINKGGINNIEHLAVVDTSIFHTYTIIKNQNEEISFLVDGALIANKPASAFASSFPLSGWQSFSSNPASSTSWDYFNYAIGPDSAAVISVPEPSTLQYVMLGFILISAARKISDKKAKLMAHSTLRHRAG